MGSYQIYCEACCGRFVYKLQKPLCCRTAFWFGLSADAYLQEAQVQWSPQLQLSQVQLGLLHGPFSMAGTFWFPKIDDVIILLIYVI